MEDDEGDDCSWLELQDLMDSSWFLNMDTTRTSLERAQDHIPPRYIFGLKEGRKRDEKLCFKHLHV